MHCGIDTKTNYQFNFIFVTNENITLQSEQFANAKRQ